MIYKKAYFELLGSISEIIEKAEDDPAFSTNESIANIITQLKDASKAAEEIIISEADKKA